RSLIHLSFSSRKREHPEPPEHPSFASKTPGGTSRVASCVCGNPGERTRARARHARGGPGIDAGSRGARGSRRYAPVRAWQILLSSSSHENGLSWLCDRVRCGAPDPVGDTGTEEDQHGEVP